MRVVVPVCAFAVMAVALAGCSEDPAPQEPAATPTPPGSGLLPPGSAAPVGGPADPGAPSPTAPPGNASAPAIADHDAPWLFLGLGLDGGAGVAGYNYKVPAWAVHEDPDFEGYSVFAFEAAWLVDGAGMLDATAMSLFLVDGTDARHMLSAIDVSYEVSYGQAYALRTTEQVHPSNSPALYQVRSDELEAGDTLGFVVAAKGDVPATGLLVRPLGHALDWNEDEASASSEELLADLTRLGQGAQLAPRATAASWQADSYLEYNYVDLAYAYHLEALTASLELEDALPRHAEPVASVRDTSLRASFPADEGWSTGYGMYFGDQGAVRWSVVGHIGDQQMDVSGVAAGLYPYALAPYGYWSATGEGPGHDVTFALQVANRDEAEIAYMVQFGYGATLTELVGASTGVGGFSTGSLVMSTGSDGGISVDRGAEGRVIVRGLPAELAQALAR